MMGNICSCQCDEVIQETPLPLPFHNNLKVLRSGMESADSPVTTTLQTEGG